MGYTADRETFVHRLAGWGFDLDSVRAILRHANVVQRFAVDRCNRETTEHEKRRRDRAEDSLKALIRRQLPGAVITTDGDPRGAVVKFMRKPGEQGDSFGGDGWCIPCR